MSFSFDKRRLAAILYGIAAFALIFSGVLFMMDRQKQSYISTYAEIKKIETWYEYNNATQTDELTGETTVIYTVNGIEHKSKLGYSSEWQIGDRLEIYYDPANPDNIIYGSTEIYPYTFAAAAIFLAAAVYLTVKTGVRSEE